MRTFIAQAFAISAKPHEELAARADSRSTAVPETMRRPSTEPRAVTRDGPRSSGISSKEPPCDDVAGTVASGSAAGIARSVSSDGGNTGWAKIVRSRAVPPLGDAVWLTIWLAPAT